MPILVGLIETLARGKEGGCQFRREPNEFLNRPPDVPFMIVPDGGHQGSVWRAALGPMLAWMTPQLAAQAAKADAAAAAQRQAHPAKPPTAPPSAPPSAPRKK